MNAFGNPRNATTAKGCSRHMNGLPIAMAAAVEPKNAISVERTLFYEVSQQLCDCFKFDLRSHRI